MKKLFTLFSVLLASAFAANALTFTVQVQNPDAVYATYYDSNYNTQKVELQQGDNVITTEYSTNLNIYANAGYAITGVTKNGTAKSLSSLTYWYDYVFSYSDDGAVYAVDAKSLDEAYDGKVYVTVDDPSKVKLEMSYGSRSVTISDDDANKAVEVGYVSAVESALRISPVTYGEVFYKVTVNGEDATASSSGYSVSLSDNAQINIVTAFPDENVKVSFDLSEGAEEYLTDVTVDGTSVEDFANGFEAKLGSKIALKSDNYTNYKQESFKVNDTEVSSFYGSYEFTLVKETVVSVVAHPYGTVKGTIIVDNPDNVSVYNGGEYGGTLLTMNVGENAVEVSEKESRITVKANSGCYITSILQGDTEKFTTGSSSITLTLAEGDVITVKSGAIERNSTAMVYIDDVSAASWGKSFSRGDRSSLDAKTGYNTVKFDESSVNDHTLNFGAYGSPVFYAYLNDEAITLPYTSATYFNGVVVANGDVIKIYLKAAPTTSTVSFTLNNVAAEQVTVTKDIITTVDDLTAGFSALSGTQVDITAADGISVSANGEALTAVDGKYTITVNADTAVEFTQSTDGIETIGADDADAVKAIYNLQGIRINSDINNLPAGIYIVNGKKIAVK